MKIRKGKLSDARQCFELTKTPEFIFPDDENFTIKYLKDFIQKGVFFVAEEKNETVGFISGQYTLAKDFWIDILIVRKDKRRQGIGRKLLKSILDVARKHKMKVIFLDAPLFNKSTVKFYQKMGLKKEKKFVWFTKEFRENW